MGEGDQIREHQARLIESGNIIRYANPDPVDDRSASGLMKPQSEQNESAYALTADIRVRRWELIVLQNDLVHASTQD